MKQFFITFFANLAALLFVLGGPILLFLLLIIASLSAGSKGKHLVTIERGSILVFDMSINVTDSPEHASPTDPLSSALSNDDSHSMSLHRLLKAIQKAAKDDRIKALFLTGSFEPADLGTGYACLKEVREAILDFKKSGKKVYAYLEAPSTRDYYVASAASEITLNPYGEMEMPGLAVTKTYYKNGFDKYGIDVQVTRVGKYKSAVEPFILTKMSDADREETQKLIDDLWGDFKNAVAESRPIEPPALQQLVDSDGYIQPQHALDAHLVDKLGYFGDVLNALGKVAPSSDYARIPLPFKQVAIADYINASHTPRLLGERGSDNVVAVLYLEGDIVDGWGQTTNIGGDRFAAELRQLRRDDDVKSVVLRVNSPGGSAYASEVIQHEIIQLKAKKPVIISMGNYAASGGYWVSTYGDRIFAEPNTLTGSIGVFGLFMDAQKLFNNTLGITFDTAKTGNFADFETISRPKTDQELALAQARVDDLYQKFTDKVSKSRNIPLDGPTGVQAIAQGRVWAGSEALDLHLVDQLGGLEDAIAYAADKAKLGTRYRVKEYPEEVTFADTLALLFNNQQEPVAKAKSDPLSAGFQKVKSELKALSDFNDPMGCYVRMPLGWEIK
ncbi:MAG: signal peptide peptidase SppA [Verrucomicrobiota bacterium]